MDTREAQEIMRRVYYERDRARGVERTILRTFQELSELSEVVMENRGHDERVSEMADVFAWVCSLANLLDIDLSEALASKYADSCSRCHSAPCQCKDSL